MSDDLHERRITGMDWPRATRHLEGRLDDLLAREKINGNTIDGLTADFDKLFALFEKMENRTAKPEDE